MSTIRTIIERTLPPFLSKKIVSTVKGYKKRAKDKKRYSYGKGEPFVRPISILGSTFDIVLDPFKNCYIDESIAEFGIWEMPLSKQLVRCIKKDAVFLDIGANIGYHSLFVASLLKGSGKVYAFEPIFHLCEQMEKSVKLNNLKNIEVCNFGIAEKNGEASINILEENTGGSTVLNLKETESSKIKRVEKISLKTLDSFLGETFKVDVIKIDIEGYEYEAFCGARNILKNNHPVIFMEFSPSLYVQDRAEKPQEIISLLKDLGYSFFLLDGRPLVLEDWLQEKGNMFRQVDVMCRVA